MSATSPSPNSSLPAVPPASTTTPPPQPQSTPPSSTSSPPLQSPPPSSSPPPQPSSSPPPQPSSPPPQPSSSPPPQPSANPPATSTPSNPSPPPQFPPPAVRSSPPPSSPPVTTVPQPSSAPPPPPTQQTPPPPSSSSAPPPPSTRSPPPSPPQTPPPGSVPPPTTPVSAPPPSSPNPPPPPTVPPQRSPPPPRINSPAPSPPVNSPPPPSPPQSPASPPTSPPKNIPPPPAAVPSRSPPSSPASRPERGPVRPAPPPPGTTPSPPDPSPPNSSSGVSPRGRPSAPSPPTTNETETSNSNRGGGIGTGGTVAIAVVVGTILLGLLGCFIWCMRKKKKRAARNGYIVPSALGSSPGSDSSFLKGHSSAPLIPSASGSDFISSPSEPGGLGNSRSWFTYEELIKATNCFSEENLLGEGGFGSVFRGLLPDGREIAVKQLKIGGGQGEREFKAEVEIIGRIHHRHLVSLVGYCISDNRRLLVYDYLPNNNLYFHLHEGKPFLDWAKRVKVAVGAARGIAYLHEDCLPRVIHRDIKSSNILLDHNFEARVSDFGLAKLALDDDTHITTRVIGTFGYVAPEYASSGKLTEKSDVYSFGVVLLELITGRKPVDTSQPMGDEGLVDWARPLLNHALDSEEFEGLTDPKLEKNYVDGEMLRMIEVAAACVRHSATKRPSMGQVVRAFESLANSDLSNGMRVGESEIFDSAQQSAEIRWFRKMAFGSQSYSTEFFSQNSGKL